MTLTIELSSQEETWLADQAAKQGLRPTDIVKGLIDVQLLPAASKEGSLQTPVALSAKNAAAIAYLDARIEADATDDPDEIREAEEEFEELQRSLNANRAATGERLVSL